MHKYTFVFFLLSIVQFVQANDTLPLPELEQFQLQPAANGWQELISYEGKFRLLVPGTVQLKTDSITTEIGNLAYHTFVYQPEEKTADNLLYLLSYCDYPINTVHSDSTELVSEFFDATVETAVTSVHGVLLYNDELFLKKYPGRIWRIDYLDGKAVIKNRAFLVNSRFYSLRTISLKEKNLNPSSDQFFESFHILD
ncbi:MAG: hypothetical protein DHS20C18_14830 [Saprospiraceae bacterium]|nr:MAG: hypothetical protein DHS20C18_14830 [Saprospiraceae bacterium]